MRLLALLLILICGAACGSREHTAAELSPLNLDAAPVVADLTSLPPLPDALPAHLLRRSAEADAELDGIEYFDIEDNVVEGGSAIELHSGETELSWAAYRFSGSFGESITGCGASLSGLDLGERAYIGISEYLTGRWHFFNPQALSNIDLPLAGPDGRYQSPGGDTYLLVLAWGGDSFDVEGVQLTYGERFAVHGTVIDNEEQPIPGVLVTSVFGGIVTTTDANGEYSVSGLPNGSWPILATKSGFTFYDQPLLATVSGADAELAPIYGGFTGSHFSSEDADPSNDFLTNPPLWPLADQPIAESISVIDDVLDCYRFVVDTPGEYYLYFSNPTETLTFPFLTLHGSGQRYFEQLVSSDGIYSGSFALGFNVFEAPAEFRLRLSSFSGYGDYSIELREGRTHLVGGNISDSGAIKINGAFTEMLHVPSGDKTTVFSSFFTGVLSYEDRYRQPGETEISTTVPGYNVSPLLIVENVAQEVRTLNFAATRLPSTDSLEPNNDFDTAAALSVPLAPTEFSLDIANGDSSDYYMFTPPAGKGLIFRFTAEKSGVSAALYDAGKQFITNTSRVEDGAVMLSRGITDGSPMYLFVQGGGSRLTSYTMQIGVFNAVPLTLGVTAGASVPLDGADFDVFLNEFDARFEMQTGANGLCPSLPLTPGAVAYVECTRHGIDVDQNTRRVVMGTEPQTVLFEASSLGLDSLEPNYLNTAVVEVPQLVSATIGPGDYVDTYALTPQHDGPFRVQLTNPGPPALFNLTWKDHLGLYVLEQRLESGDEIYLPNNSFAGQQLVVGVIGVPGTTYDLDISHSPAFRISGNISGPTAGPLDRQMVYNDTTGEFYFTNESGNYVSPLLPVGDYSLTYHSLEYTPYVTTVPVTIADSGVVVDFSGMVLADKDNYEPNDDQLEAEPLVLDTDYVATVGAVDFANDRYDLYSVTTVAGQRILFRVTTTTPQCHGLFLDFPVMEMFVMSDEGEIIATNRTLSKTEMLIEFVAPRSDTYFLSIDGYADYTLRAESVS